VLLNLRVLFRTIR